MPRRNDIKRVLIIGSGPIVIGQACEFDYSGSQACKALKEEGYEVVLINSNPATIMTDPELADRTYIEPITPEIVEKIIQREKPDVILPTVGGQTALNTAMALHEKGILEKYNVELIGANIDAIKKAEDRELFKKAMQKIGVGVPDSGLANNIEEALLVLEKIKLPLIIRPAFTLGGSGGSIVYNREDFVDHVNRGLSESPIHQVLLEESVLGWKEYELEVMRDTRDNVVIICSIENFDPMGVHTGDSITVAPQQTLTDREYQNLRDLSIKIIREIGVDTGGSNIQFGVNPEDGRIVVIEMNPRVSRSSALASKATGFPIAKIAAKLAIGYTLDEIRNDITRETPASFEPTIDYVVVKVPRFNFEKFPGSDPRLGTQMKSVGETMAIGRTFKEALQKAIRGLETGRHGLGSDGNLKAEGLLHSLPVLQQRDYLEKGLVTAKEDRIFNVKLALKLGWSVDRLHKLTKIDPWFLAQMEELVDAEKAFADNVRLNGLSVENVTTMKRLGYSDRQLAFLIESDLLMKLHDRNPDDRREYARTLKDHEKRIQEFRFKHNIRPGYRLVDTCGGEFEAYTPYYYSSYDDEDEARDSDKKKVMILGGGPNRIGQGIEFDYCCCHASYALREMGIQSIMVNSNPETVSTDYDTSDKLYFEPLTVEDILHIYQREKPEGVIVQFGGQTPLRIAQRLEELGVKVLGTSVDSIDRAEDRERFAEVVKKLGLNQPNNGISFSQDEALKVAQRIGYPVLVRPSYVLGGRAMQIVYDDHGLTEYIRTAVEISPEHPVLVDKFLEDALEIDVDAICDGETVYVGAIMEHIEEAGIHSGDSACMIPTRSISESMLAEIEKQTKELALELGVKGLINIQFALKGDTLYVLEVNPRASRTVPFVSKAKGVPLAKIAVKVMLGQKLSSFGLVERKKINYMCVKEAVLPFNKFQGADIILGPEMRSTGEVMGIAKDFTEAFYKAQLGAGDRFPVSGKIFVSLYDETKAQSLDDVKLLVKNGFSLVGTEGTAEFFKKNSVPCETVLKVSEGRPNIVDLIKNGDICMIFNTPVGKGPKEDQNAIRQAAIRYKLPLVTTVSAIHAAVQAVTRMQTNSEISVKSIQEYHKENK
jgi:carbamoyl-phosphate synthase large subunit